MWRIRSVAWVGVLGTALLAAEEKPHTFAFKKGDVGRLPTGWKADHTGKGEGSVWKIVPDDTAPSGNGCALAQTSAMGAGAFFNLCVNEDTKFRDLEMSVAFKAVGGKEDQGGGLVWRYRDHGNYYICRMNPLEDNFRVYKVVGGKRMQMGTQEGLKVPAGEWHRIKISMQGDRIRCWLDDKPYLNVRDTTFPEAGKVGLWSKADAQTHFDELRIAEK